MTLSRGTTGRVTPGGSTTSPTPSAWTAFWRSAASNRCAADPRSSPSSATFLVTPIVRHNVANVFFDEVTRDHVQVSSYFTVVTQIGLDHVGRYRDTFTPDGGIWRIRHRKVSTDWVAPDSVMARRSH